MAGNSAASLFFWPSCWLLRVILEAGAVVASVCSCCSRCRVAGDVKYRRSSSLTVRISMSVFRWARGRWCGQLGFGEVTYPRARAQATNKQSPFAPASHCTALHHTIRGGVLHSHCFNFPRDGHAHRGQLTLHQQPAFVSFPTTILSYISKLIHRQSDYLSGARSIQLPGRSSLECFDSPGVPSASALDIPPASSIK